MGEKNADAFSTRFRINHKNDFLHSTGNISKESVEKTIWVSEDTNVTFVTQAFRPFAGITAEIPKMF